MTQSQALDILKTGANVFLTGEPGSGKTHTVNVYVEYLRAHGIEPAITASTGIAATHIHGQTIHSWSGIGINRTLSPYDIDRIATTEHVVKRIQKTKALIIDEISMIDATTLDMVDTILRAIKQNDEPFGGIQIVMVGDFFQLPPITQVGQQPHFAFVASVWGRMKPVICYLTEQHRQRDTEFLSLLSAIRKNTYGPEDHRVIERKLYQPTDDVIHDFTATRLFSHNKNVDAINTVELNKLPTLSTCFLMQSKGRETLVAQLKKGCLSPEELELKIGAVVMCTKNNQQKGYANGTLGTVLGFEPGTKFPIIETKDGIRITIEPAEWIIEENGKTKAMITQVPLRLAWAITIHKSQGMSLDAAVMDLRDVFEYGQGYVALSRVRSLDGLHILGWNRQAFLVHPQILEKDQYFMRQSESAAAIFGDMSQIEREKMQHNFVLASGGVVDRVKKKSTKKVAGDTFQTSLALVLQGRSIGEIAKERSLAPVTIIGHIEKLVQQRRLGVADIIYLIDKKTFSGFEDIKATFVSLDTSKLTPIREHYNGKFTYEQLRFARMLIELGYPH